jgi:aspartate racemase
MSIAGDISSEAKPTNASSTGVAEWPAESRLRPLGLLGGMSWESTLIYYRRLNQIVREVRGGLASAPLVLHSVDFERIVALQRSGRWSEAADLLAMLGTQLARAGAEALLLCTNTMHCIADRISEKVPVPLLHIAHPVGMAAQAAGVTRLGLLGTRFTMEQGFYADYLAQHFDLEVLTPPVNTRAEVHRQIFEELCCGVVRPASRRALVGAVDGLAAAGAQAVVLACTELCLALTQSDTDVPLLDSTELHARVGARFVLGISSSA